MLWVARPDPDSSRQAVACWAALEAARVRLKRLRSRDASTLIRLHTALCVYANDAATKNTQRVGALRVVAASLHATRSRRLLLAIVESFCECNARERATRC